MKYHPPLNEVFVLQTLFLALPLWLLVSVSQVFGELISAGYCVVLLSLFVVDEYIRVRLEDN